jgi:hypothetical protein
MVGSCCAWLFAIRTGQARNGAVAPAGKVSSPACSLLGKSSCTPQIGSRFLSSPNVLVREPAQRSRCPHSQSSFMFHAHMSHAHMFHAHMHKAPAIPSTGA